MENLPPAMECVGCHRRYGKVSAHCKWHKKEWKNEGRVLERHQNNVADPIVKREISEGARSYWYTRRSGARAEQDECDKEIWARPCYRCGVNLRSSGAHVSGEIQGVFVAQCYSCGGTVYY